MNKKFTRGILNGDLAVANTMLALLIVFTFIAVIMRYVVKHPVTWGEEFQCMAIVVIVFFGSGAGFRLKSHVAIEFVVELFPKKAQKAIAAAMYVLTVIILAYFLMHSARYAAQMWRTDRVTNILRIPYGLIYASFPIGCVLMLVNYSLQYFGFLGQDDEEAAQ